MTKRKPPLFQRTRAELGRKTALIWRKMGQDWRKKGKKIIKNCGSEHKSWTSILLCLALWLVCETSLSGIMNLMFYVSVCVCVRAHTLIQLRLTFCNFMGYSPPGFSVHGNFQQEYWSSLPFLPPEDLPDPGIAPKSPASPTLAGGFFNAEPPGKPLTLYSKQLIHQALSVQTETTQLRWDSNQAKTGMGTQTHSFNWIVHLAFRT